MTKEQAEAHLADPAVFCCRRQKGLTISAADLEDPDIFDDMEEAGLLKLSPDGLTVAEVLGSTLTQDVEALTPITADVLDHVGAKVGAPAVAPAAPAPAAAAKPAAAPISTTMTGGTMHIQIDAAEKIAGLSIDTPLGGLGAGAGAAIAAAAAPATTPAAKPAGTKKVIRTLIKKHIKITDAVIGTETKIENGVITIDGSLVDKAVKEDPLCKSLKLDVIHPNERHIYTDTIMDVCPIATKVEGVLGEGVTKVADGVVFLLTGVDEDGVQVHEFGSSEGFLNEKMYFGHPGCADEGDIIIRCHAVIAKKSGMTRPGPFAAHKCEDYIIQPELFNRQRINTVEPLP